MWNTLIIDPFTNLLLWIYSVLANIPGAFGWAIILFTIAIRAITWPLNAQQLKGAQAMQELQNDKDWQSWHRNRCAFIKRRASTPLAPVCQR